MMAEAMAVAQGDPTRIGYLVGGNFGRGFPQFVRRFHANFLALPALPSQRLPDASDDREIVVRAIRTPSQGTYLGVVNTGLVRKEHVQVRVPQGGVVQNAVAGTVQPVRQGCVEIDLDPFELRSFRVEQ